MNIPVTRTTREIKKNNVVQVIEALKSQGAVTKSEVAAETGLSVATCGTVLNELCQSGEALIVAQAASSGGRPAQRYACNPDFYSVLSLYAEGSDASATLVWSVTSATGEMLVQGEQDFMPLTLENFYQQAESLIKAWPGIKVLGVGLPGVVTDGVVLSCDISLFVNVPVVQALQQRFGLYVQVDNDMNYTAWGFYRSSCADTSAPVAYILKPDVPCTGCGIVINGQVLQGASFFAGEVSCLPWQNGENLSLTDELGKILASLAAMINPVTVALAGPRLREEMLPLIRQRCADHIPERHIPHLVFRHAVRPDYLQGIAELSSQRYMLHRLFGG
ncbi:ROK family protein [Erwinia sp. P6884]|uniref:ROK family transcriptional regulator n=1 Tax=Erwinia sp. P6884 TaxID=3141450 RepID=UPI0031937E4D